MRGEVSSDCAGAKRYIARLIRSKRMAGGHVPQLGQSEYIHQVLRSFPSRLWYKCQRRSLLSLQRDNAAPPALPRIRRLQTYVPLSLCVLDASRPAAPFTERLTMEQAPPPDPEIANWLHTLGVTFLCQW